jgi:cytidine deaminase
MERQPDTQPPDAATVAELLRAAREVQARAYAPFSKFAVGAALLAEDGRVFTACNVENSSYGLSVCAERAAVAAAVAAGALRFRAVAIVVSGDKPATPCGACRQVLVEFSPDMTVILGAPDGSHSLTTAAELLPGFFRL